MDKYIYDEKNGLWYELRGDYYLPCLRLPETTEVHIGIWGQRHRRYLKEHRKTAYTRLLTSGRLNKYLADIDHQAEELFSQLVSQMAAAEGITEALKAADQMEWVRRTNSIRNRAREIVNSELIHN
ncbi:MAG: TnpV protein [Eubacteriales bacterium]|nr:TnpV protein [Eubacteriales bacterium]